MKECMKKIMALILTVLILTITGISICAESINNLKFTDVKTTSWYYSYVTKLVELKITAGIGNNMFGPNLSVTRAEFVTFLCNVKGYKQMQGNPFVDSRKSWASGYITAALANGIIDIPADPKFNPNYSITRQEVAEMLCRALNVPPDETTENPYSDVKTDSGYSTAAYSNYLMRGSTENNKLLFKPKDKLTRAEAAVIIVNAFDYNADKLAYLNKRISEENLMKEEAGAKARRHQEWLDGMDKGVSKELLGCTDLLGDYTLEEQHFRLMEDLKDGKWPYWSSISGVSDDQLADEMVRVGRKVVETYINSDYRNTDVLKSGWTDVMISGYDIDSKIKKFTDNKWILEGYFYTGKSLLTYDSIEQPTLRGTIRYRWLKPSQLTGRTEKVNVWYEEDITLGFYPQNSGIKANGMWYTITETRVVK